ncbi:MAG: cytidylate kinase-like family protein [Ktedonobacteraceae bacterium]|nr:cytidylate kinase-like family protein [Ktedonobacteraceae bacterium]
MAGLFRGRGQPKTVQPKEPGATQILPETTWAAEESLPAGIPPEGTLVVTISRQFGSGGAEIAHLVAQETGLLYVDHQIIDEVATRLGVNAQQAASQDEYTAGTARHILEAIHASHPFNTNYTSLFGTPLLPAPSNEIAYLHLTQKVILEMASKGNAVIVGRGSQFLLHNSPRTLHIHIFAPLAYRIENVKRALQVDQEQAMQMIEQRDYDHDAYLRRYYGSDGHQPSLYHLLINTGLFPLELAASFISQALPATKEIR